MWSCLHTGALRSVSQSLRGSTPATTPPSLLATNNSWRSAWSSATLQSAVCSTLFLLPIFPKQAFFEVLLSYCCHLGKEVTAGGLVTLNKLAKYARVVVMSQGDSAHQPSSPLLLLNAAHCSDWLSSAPCTQPLCSEHSYKLCTSLGRQRKADLSLPLSM